MSANQNRLLLRKRLMRFIRIGSQPPQPQNSSSTKRERYIVGLLGGVASSLVTSIIMIGAQYFLTTHQIREELSSWKEKETSRIEVEERQRQRALAREFRELHEELLSADTVFWFASELTSFQSTIERHKVKLTPKAQKSLDDVFDRVAKNLGLGV